MGLPEIPRVGVIGKSGMAHYLAGEEAQEAYSEVRKSNKGRYCCLFGH
jgi:hypothetical protein